MFLIFYRNPYVSNVVLFILISFFRRGGEPARLRLKQYHEAISNLWVDTDRLSQLNLTPVEIGLLKSNKIGYMVGKGDRLVPIIFTRDTLPALEILANQDIRRAANVQKDNPYLFPSTRQSKFHHSGWHSFKSICQNVALKNPDNITFTKNRHLVATIYSRLEIPEEERTNFYEHMGHSQEMNKSRYQCPPAVKELTKVGKSLFDIDEGKISLIKEGLLSYFLLYTLFVDLLSKCFIQYTSFYFFTAITGFRQTLEKLGQQST